MPDREAEEEFEYLLDLLASDGVEPNPPFEGDATGSRRGTGADGGFGIHRGTNGRLDLGQVKAYYERKNKGLGKGVPGVSLRNGPRLTDHSGSRPGLCDDSDPEALCCLVTPRVGFVLRLGGLILLRLHREGLERGWWPG